MVYKVLKIFYECFYYYFMPFAVILLTFISDMHKDYIDSLNNNGNNNAIVNPGFDNNGFNNTIIGNLTGLLNSTDFTNNTIPME